MGSVDIEHAFVDASSTTGSTPAFTKVVADPERLSALKAWFSDVESRVTIGDPGDGAGEEEPTQ